MAKITLNKTVSEDVEIDLSTPIYRTYLGSLYRKYYEENGEVKMAYIALGRYGGLTITSGANEIQQAINCEGNYKESNEQEFKAELQKLLAQLNLL